MENSQTPKSRRGTIVMISSVHWHITWQRHQAIAAGLAKRGYNVEFIEPLPKRWPKTAEINRVMGRLLGHSREAGLVVQEIPAGVSVISPPLLPDKGWIAQTINRKVFIPGIIKSLFERCKNPPVITINYLPIMASLTLQQGLKPDLAIYDCVIDWKNDPYAQGADVIERRLVESVDLVFTDSPALFERMSDLHPNVKQVLPAVNIDVFNRSIFSTVASDRTQPTCGYFGGIGASLDVDLLREISHLYRLKLIGPLRISLEGFSTNTEYCGAVAHDQIPALIKDVDVLLLAYRDAPHMRSVIPAKTFECLASGIPTVTSGLISLDQFADLFYICQSRDEFLKAIEQALNEDPSLRERRMLCAERNSWTQRIDEIEEYIDHMMNS